jgi:hypothetical protein
MAQVCNWAYHEPNGSGGLAGGSFGERRHNAGKQAMTRASLGPRGGARRLGWRWELTERGAHRSGDNGGRWRCMCVRGRNGMPFK